MRPRATRVSEGSHDMGHGMGHDLGRNIAFLTRLRQIADACEPGAECPTSALALFNIYLARLYARLDIGQSNRPTHKARAEADSTLAELRLDVLRIEVASARVCADVFAAIRYHIEMARRALAIRITRDDDTQDDWLDGAAVRPSATVLIFDARFRVARHDRMLPLAKELEKVCADVRKTLHASLVALQWIWCPELACKLPSPCGRVEKSQRDFSGRGHARAAPHPEICSVQSNQTARFPARKFRPSRKGRVRKAKGRPVEPDALSGVVPSCQ